MRRALHLLVASILLIPLGALTWLGLTESGLHWAVKKAEPYLPGEFSMHKLEGRLMGTITIKGLEYTQAGALIKAKQLSLNWLPATLLTSTVDISRLHVSSLRVELPQTKSTDQPLTLPDINLPWRVAVKNVLVDGFQLKQNEQTFTLEQIRLDASSLFSQLDIDELSIRTDNFSLTVEGEVLLADDYTHKLDVRWQTKLPSSAVIKGNGHLAGNLTSTQVKQHLTGALQLSFDAELTDLLGQLSWQATANITAFEAEKLAAGWPTLTGKSTLVGSGDLTTATLSGTLHGQYPELGPFDAEFEVHRLSENRLRLDRLSLNAPDSDTSLFARGQWQPGKDGGNVALALSWQNVRWPLTDGAWFDSAIGSGWVEGSLHQYRAGLATDRPWPQAPPSFWYASADGNLDGLSFHSLRITTLNGEVLAGGQLNWSPQLAWNAQATATHIDPSQFVPLGARWPGQLKATLTSKGRYEDNQLQTDVDITQLTGKLRGYPVSLRSRLGWRNAGIDIHSLEFHSGHNQIIAQGRIGETLKMDWSIAATDLAELYPQAHGKLKAKGLLTGPRNAPSIQAMVSGQELALPDYTVGRLDGSLHVDMFEWQKNEINLAAEALVLKGVGLQSLTINGTEQNIVAKATSEEFTALLEFMGKAHDQGWRGRIEKAELRSKQFNDWRLKAASELFIGADSLDIKSLCLESTSSDICMQAEKQNDNWRTMLDLKQVPLALLSPWLPADMKLEGVVNAKADIKSQAARTMGEVNAQLPAGIVSYPLLEGERNRWEYRSGSMTISLMENGINTKSEITMNNGDYFKFKAELPGAQFFSIDQKRQPLSAEGQLTIHDLGIIEALIPEVQNPHGEVALNIVADGTLAHPNFSGRAVLTNGGFSIPRLGLKIEKIKFTGQSDRFNELHFRLDARSAEGNLALQGQTILDRHAGWPTAINIKGKEFEIAHIPEAQVSVSPDLQVKLEKNKIDIKGDVHVPAAKLQPKDLTTAVRVSDDVIIVGKEQAADKKWSIFTQVRLTLGERVNFYGFGFEGRFGGSLLLVDEPGQLTKATGELSIPEGRYRAYGQRLDVENGRLLYTGGPVTNPGLNLRAVRHVNNVTTGLNVRGSLNQPQIELFSIPAMGQTDALSYLVLGRPIENATGEEGAMLAKATLALGLSGGNKLVRSLTEQFGLDEMRVESSESNEQASLVMGRYLSPKLYVSYGVGLIEAFNTLTVRYQISDKWQLKGESGEYHGADLFYTIER